MGCISGGTPGIRMRVLPLSVKTKPGAVPTAFFKIWAFVGTVAWSTKEGRFVPYRLVRSSAISLLKVKSEENSSAATWRVISSRVGPSPPVVITKSDLARASLRPSARASFSSGSTVWRAMLQPKLLRDALIYELLVFTIIPFRISSAIAIISIRILTP